MTKIIKGIFLAAAAATLSGCASFRSGDLNPDPDIVARMRKDRAMVPFAEINFTWTNYAYFNPADLIGKGTLEGTPPPKPEPVDKQKLLQFKGKAERVLKEAGLYDPARGKGTLRLDFGTYGRWSYSDLFDSYLVETPWIMIRPSSLDVNYRMAASFDRGGLAAVEATARHRTVFHALVFPLYPFARPGAKENSLFNDLMWKTAADIYARLNAPPPAAAAGPEKPAETAAQTAGAPSVPKDTAEIQHEPIAYPGPGSTKKLPGQPLP